MQEGNSSYSFKPKAPDNWSVKTYDRNGKKVSLIRLKPWQLEAHMLLRGALFGFLRAFCGSGKTIVARSIAAYKIIATGKRQVFCVPRNDIGNDGFAAYFDIEVPGRRGSMILRCDAPLNFCSDRSDSKIDELVRILCRDPVVDDCAGKDRVLSSMQIVITHQCLTLAIKKIKKNPRMFKRFIRNNTFWIDEGHHIKGHDESDDEKATMNLLGKFANDVLAGRQEGVELFAMTATPYRGDYSRLFSAKQLDGFVTYSLDFLDHFPTLGIENIDMELEEYSDIDDVIGKVCKNIGEELDNKHFVFVPPTGRKWRKNKKDVEKMFDAIYRTIMEKTGCDLEAAKSRVLDLVTENTQKFNDGLLRREPKCDDEHPSRFTVVVACMKCREGSDWCPGDRIHNTSMEDSPPLNFQTNGRLFRRFPGKKHIKIRYYVERFRPISVGKREFVSDRVNYILHYMLMDDLLNPIMVDIPPFVPAGKKEKNSGGGRSRTTLEEIFSHQYQAMKKYLLNGLAELEEFNEESVDQLISHVMQEHLPENRKFTKGQASKIRMALKAFILRCRSGKLRKEGVDVSFIRKNGFDSIVERNGISGNMFTSGLTFKELKRFRETVKKMYFTEEQRNKIAEGIRTITLKKFDPQKDLQQYLNALYSNIKDFDNIRKAYKKCSETKDFSPEAVARIIKKPVEQIKKMIALFNRFCMGKEVMFNFRKDSKLALIVEKVA